jgi:hypothetical protein
VLLWLIFSAAAASAQVTAVGDAILDPADTVGLRTGPLAHVFAEGAVNGTPDINDDMPTLRIDLDRATCRRDRALGAVQSHFVHFAPTVPGTALGLLSFGDRKIVALTFANGCFRVTADAMRLGPATPEDRALEAGRDGLYVSGSGTMLAFVFTDTVADSVRVFVEAAPSIAPIVDARITRCELDVTATPRIEVEVSASIDTRVVLLAPWATDCSSPFPTSSYAPPMHELALPAARAGELIEIVCDGAPGRTMVALLPEGNAIAADPGSHLFECTPFASRDAGIVGVDAAAGVDASVARRDGGGGPPTDSSIPSEQFEFRGAGGCACSAGQRTGHLSFGVAALVWAWIQRRRSRR